MASTKTNRNNRGPIKGIRILAAALIVIFGCSLSVGAAISEIFQNTNPQVAAASWPKNGFALNAVVDGKLGEHIADTDKKSVSAQQWLSISNQALAAFRYEPLNASALRSLALAAEANGDTVRANTLMANAVKFSRRDTAANNWQFIQALKSQDLTRSLQLVDRILRENNALRSQYLPVLIAGVAQPAGYATIYPMLAKQPQWEAEFWTKAASQPNLPAELGILRQRLLEYRLQKTPMVPFQINDVRLIRNLVRNGEFDAAKSLHSYLANQKQRSAGSNASAIAATDFTAYDSALDWQLTSRGDVQAYLNDTGSGISAEVGANSIGVFARHLVKAENGRFRIKISAQAVREVELFARLRCAEKSKQTVVYDLVFTPNSWIADQAVEPTCQWFTLELLAQNKSSDAALINIENIVATSIF